jgi:hypothetical protein
VCGGKPAPAIKAASSPPDATTLITEPDIKDNIFFHII